MREEELLIRGLIRDGLFESAAGRIDSFIRAYPQYSRREAMAADIVATLLKNDMAEAATPLMAMYLDLFPEGGKRGFMAYNLAIVRHREQQDAEAVSLLRLALAGKSIDKQSRAGAQELLAELLFGQGDYAGVEELVEAADPRGGNDLLQFYRAYSLLRRGETEPAEEVLFKLAGRRAGSPVRLMALRVLAQELVVEQRWDELHDLLGGWEPAGEGDEAARRELRLSQALAFYHRGEYEEAYAAVEPLWRDQKPAASPLQLPASLIALREFAAAEGSLLQLTETLAQPFQRLEAFRMLFEVQLALGEDEALVKTARRFAELTPLRAAAVAMLVRAALAADELGLRIDLLREALTRKPSAAVKAEISFLLGEAREARGELEAAAELYGQAATSGIFSAWTDLASLRLARLRASAGQYEETLSVLGQLISRSPSRRILVDASQLDAISAAALGQWEEAAAQIEALRLNMAPGEIDPETLRIAGLTAYTRGEDLEAARERVEYVLSMGDAGALEDALIDEARALHKRGDRHRADAMLDYLAMAGAGAARDSAGAVRVSMAAGEGDHQRAYELATEMAEQGGSITSWARLAAADAAMAGGDAVESARQLSEVLNSSSDPLARRIAVERLQKLAVGDGRFGTALQIDPRFSALSPEAIYSAERRLGEAAMQYQNGNFEAAAAIYAQHPDRDAMPALHQMLYASALYHLGRLDAAAEISAGVDDDDMPALLRWERMLILAEHYAAQREPEKALDLLEQLLSQPIPAAMREEALLEAARAADAAGEWPRADELYQAYVRSSRERPADPAVFESIASSYVKREQYGAAIRLYEQMQLRAAAPGEAAGYAFHAAELSVLRDGPLAAAEAFLTIAYRNPELGDWPARARFRAAELFEKAGDLDSAERQYRFVAEQFPRSSAAQQAAARLRDLSRRREHIEEDQLRPPGG